ncbi:hypothetical protein BJ322DRAFT_1017568 [Thelephora terrestris]|uniref:Uncharacterized protein n=1 Tax=Thelephora terrestris TaxID=56493 RepID=A0A9P6HNG0_9AGAM|nr:hypothetical protein BJ322DRAFT_1017568 [Thelephora terrestris]
MFASIATNIGMTSEAGWEEGCGMVGLLLVLRLESSEEIFFKSGGGVKDGPNGLGRIVIENFKDVGDGEDFEKELQESNESFLTVVSFVKQGASSKDEVEAGSRETPGEVWFDLMSEGLSEVVTEMHEGVFQDGLGCEDCWVNPTLRSVVHVNPPVEPPPDPHPTTECGPVPQKVEMLEIFCAYTEEPVSGEWGKG